MAGVQAGPPGIIAGLMKTVKTILPPPESKLPSCANCGKVDKKAKAEIYDVDLDKCFCRFCAVLVHHPTTNFEENSLEEIITHENPLKIFSPVLLDLCLLYAVSWIMSGPGVTPEYFNGQSYCPALSRGRRWLAQLDANLFFYWKARMSQFCDWEDSYWRFFTDTWVRGILTNTDSWLLILSEFIYAFIFEEFMRTLVTPFVAIVYAIVASIVEFVEWHLSQILLKEHKDTLGCIGEVMSRISFASRLVIKEKKVPPPPTYLRKRPMKDWVELAKYRYGRHIRLVRFYKAQAQTACRFILQGSLQAAIAIRALCILLGNSALLKAVELVGLSDLGKQHVTWFAESTGLSEKLLTEGAYLSDTRYSDWLALAAIQQTMKNIPVIGQVGQDVCGSLWGGICAIRPFAKRYSVLILLVVPYVLFKWKISIQQKAYKDNWKKVRKDLYGDMNRDRPCQDWKTVQFK